MTRDFSVQGQRVVVVGAARSGLAAAETLARRGARVVLTDHRLVMDGTDRLRDLGVTDPELDAIRASIEITAKDAYDFADASPIPDPATLYDYTYAPARS